MKLDAKKFGLAAGCAFAILWVICSLMVLIMPMGMMSLTGNMVHGDLSNLGWHMGFSGIIAGLFAWSLGAGITGWLLAVLYNKQI